MVMKEYIMYNWSIPYTVDDTILYLFVDKTFPKYSSFYVGRYLQIFVIFGSVLANISYLVCVHLQDLVQMIHIAMTTETNWPIKTYQLLVMKGLRQVDYRLGPLAAPVHKSHILIMYYHSKCMSDSRFITTSNVVRCLIVHLLQHQMLSVVWQQIR